METTKSVKVDAVFLYSGYSDFWSGDGERWEPNKGCLFASYSAETTIADIVEGWMEDFAYGGADFDGDENTLYQQVTDDALRKALREVWHPWVDLDQPFDTDAPSDETPDDVYEYPSAIVLVRLSEEDEE